MDLVLICLETSIGMPVSGEFADGTHLNHMVSSIEWQKGRVETLATEVMLGGC
jgi:hypothetical protein